MGKLRVVYKSFCAWWLAMSMTQVSLTDHQVGGMVTISWWSPGRASPEAQDC